MDFTTDLVSAVHEIIIDSKWQKIGYVNEIMKMGKIKLYPDINDDDNVVQLDDIVIFCVDGNGGKQFYAIDCACPHEGGPLDLGDIEDMGANGLSVICPWHSYDFNLNNGTSSTGLKTNVYETKIADDVLYIKCDHLVSLTKPCEQVKKYDEILPSHLKQNEINGDNEESLCKHAATVLNTEDPVVKADMSREHFKNWKLRVIPIGSYKMPDQPKRKEELEIKDPGRIKIGRGGTLESRIAIIHSLANIEQWAIDLSWDIIGRFSLVKINNNELPVEFFADFLKVADDEAKHFSMLNQRLEELGSHFGALPVHNGLWQSAEETSHDLLARLAIVHMVHEARGLDVHPKTKQRFAAQKDYDSVALLDIIYEDEITHVACGMKWFTYVCKNLNPPLDPVTTFHKLVKKHFKGYLKPPFNTAAREIAGMTEEWYSPLVKKH